MKNKQLNSFIYLFRLLFDPFILFPRRTTAPRGCAYTPVGCTYTPSTPPLAFPPTPFLLFLHYFSFNPLRVYLKPLGLSFYSFFSIFCFNCANSKKIQVLVGLTNYYAYTNIYIYMFVWHFSASLDFKHY